MYCHIWRVRAIPTLESTDSMILASTIRRNILHSTKQQIGCIHRHLRSAPPQLCRKTYITTTLPKLEYCSAVWDPHHAKRRQQLENVQKFAGRVITNNWTSGYEPLCSSLGLMKLTDRRKTQKLKLCYKIVNNLFCIPSFTLSPHPHPSPRAPNSKQLSLPLARTEAHKQSFFVNVVSLWTALPEAIVSAPSPCILKHHLYRLYSA